MDTTLKSFVLPPAMPRDPDLLHQPSKNKETQLREMADPIKAKKVQVCVKVRKTVAQSAGTVDYTDCSSAEG